MESIIEKQVDPGKIMQIGMGFWASKTLLIAVKMGLFTYLGKGPMTGVEIRDELSLNKRGVYDFLDTLVALGLLQREGLKETALYSNSEDSNIFLDKNKPSYVGGILEMSNDRLYNIWSHLEEGLKTGLPQNEAAKNGHNIFEVIYADKNMLREFVSAMGGVQAGNFIAFANKFDFAGYTSLCDMGGAGALLSAQVALHNPHMKCISYDLPPVSEVAAENVEQMNLQQKVKIQSGDFFKEDFPQADVITMGNILHDWGVKDKLFLMQKAYDALPEGGALVVIENVIDNNRSENAFGLMMSLNMQLETREGFDFSGDDFEGWAKEVGFRETKVMPLTGPSSAVIAIK